MFEGDPERDVLGTGSAPFKPLQSKVIVPTQEEINENRRARSAKMRIAVRNVGLINRNGKEISITRKKTFTGSLRGEFLIKTGLRSKTWKFMLYPGRFGFFVVFRARI